MFEQLLASLARSLDGARIPYMIIGGQAVLLHGLVRVTDDVDLTLGVDAGQCARVLGALREAGLEPRVPNPEQFVRRAMILPALHPEHRVRVDVTFSFTPYEQQAIEHAVVRQRDGYPVRFATAEDLIIHKLVAGRAQDIQDIEGIVLRRGRQLDLQYLRQWVKQFAGLEGKAHLQQQLEALLIET